VRPMRRVVLLAVLGVVVLTGAGCPKQPRLVETEPSVSEAWDVADKQVQCAGWNTEDNGGVPPYTFGPVTEIRADVWTVPLTDSRGERFVCEVHVWDGSSWIEGWGPA
jgi:hypothetical protein